MSSFYRRQSYNVPASSDSSLLPPSTAITTNTGVDSGIASSAVATTAPPVVVAADRDRKVSVDSAFASDRSPLQKVETIVNGMREDMSKEEKRAQLMQAEEQLARTRSGKQRAAPVDYDDGGEYYPSVDMAPQRTRTNPDAGRQRRAELYQQGMPVDNGYGSQPQPAMGRNDTRRRSEGPRVLTKPPPDSRAVSDSYGQPPQRQRSVREGRVFDTDPGYVDDGYDQPTSPGAGGYANGDHDDRDESPRGTSGGVISRVKSLFKRKRASQQPPTDGYYDEYQEDTRPPMSPKHRDHQGFSHHEEARRHQHPQSQRDPRQDNHYPKNVPIMDPAAPIAATPAVVPAQVDDRPWWEKPSPSQSRRRSAGLNGATATTSAAAPAPAVQPVTASAERTRDQYRQSQQQMPQTQQTYFQPQLYLRCGPLLRFTGLRKSSRNAEKEVWTGSCMIVTVDSKSRYEQVPNLRIFKQPVELLPPPPRHIDEASGQQLSPEYIDPIAGQVKMSRVGKTLYVRPVEALDEHRDLSRIEDDSGLFEEYPSQPYERPSGKGTTGGLRPIGQDGELRGRFQDIPAYVLHRERGVTFWKWNLEIELSDRQVRLAYRINRGPALGFWVPARGETMNMMFHSCNGFSLSVNPDDFSGPDPLWRDVLNTHQTRPFHLMIGGGDQIYMDAATVQTRLFGEWSKSREHRWKHEAPFTREMQEELEKFWLNRYAMWFSQGLFGMATALIPMVNIWDDHDIIDGFGSYPHHTMASPVMSGVGNVAFKYYMLFQHQSLPTETEKTEPSWLLGRERGPYIREYSRSVYMRVGSKTALLGLDCRTERMRDEIMSQDTWDVVFERLRREIRKGATQHLLVVLGVPIAYPRLNFLENVLTSRAMDPLKAIGRTGALGGFVNKFDGGVEILDDLDDHWTAKHHKDERNWFIQELQELSADLSVRITLLSGDVHLGAVGQFYSNKALGLPKDQDHRYMPNVISSAIVNTPPSDMVADVLNKRNKIHHLDEDTEEDMMPMFPEDVNEKKRNNKHLLPRRNWASIREYKPELTPPPSPVMGEMSTESFAAQGGEKRGLGRRLSLGSAGNLPGMGLVRRLSGRAFGATGEGQRNSAGVSHPPVAFNQRNNDFSDRRRSYDAPRRASADMARSAAGPASEGDLSRGGGGPGGRPNPFLRRPTFALPNNPTHMINLRGGLDIRLNCENERGDPAGTTTEYRLIVPALDYRGQGDPNPEAVKPQSRLSKLVRGFSQRKAVKGAYDGEYSDEEMEDHHQASRIQNNDSWDSLQQEPLAPVPVNAPPPHQQMQSQVPPPMRQRARRQSQDIADVPLPPNAAAAGVAIGANGLPVRTKSKTAANTSAPVPAGVSMRGERRSSVPVQEAGQMQTGQMQGGRPDTYAGPNTIIPANLPPPPAGGPPGMATGLRGQSAGSRGVSAGVGGGQARERVPVANVHRGVGEGKRRASGTAF